MKKFVALLRGVNVSGHRKLPMTDLRKWMEEADFSHVQTYIQSGNVVFESEGNETDLTRKLEQLIHQKTGYDVPVWIITAERLTSVIKSNPFIGEGFAPEYTHVTWLDQEPTTEGWSKLKEIPLGADQWQAGERCVYLQCPKGYGQTKLDNSVIERKLAVRATTRNWNTNMKLLEMLSA